MKASALPPKGPWAYFLAFLAVLSLLSYMPLPALAGWALALLGLGLPLAAALRAFPPPRRIEKPSCLQELALSPPLWLWILAAAFLLFLRLDQLPDFPRWPNLDEGWIGTLALELSRHWTWKFFYTFGEAPPLTVWAVALGLKLGLPPAWSLWLPPALVSLATVVAAYATARRFFSRSFSLVFGGLTAFSCWPLFIGRVCHQGIWLPLWVLLCGWAWGGFQKAPKPAAKARWAVALGVLLGLGSFTFTPWLWVAAVLFPTFAKGLWSAPRAGRRFFGYFLAAFCLTLLPFLHAVLTEGFGGHILSLSPWGGWYRWSDLPAVFFHYGAALFGGPLEKDPAYTPLVGGFLNPLLGAFFFLGLVELFRFRKEPLLRWVAPAFFLFLVPGALSLNVETFRVAQVMPLLLFITALGGHSLLAAWPAARRLRLLVLVLALSGCLDFYLLAAPYRNPDAHPENFGRPVKSLERYRAYRILERIQEAQGPGWVLTDFDTGSFNDPTLSFMAYPFNVARNTGLESSPCRWMAVFVNVHYQPFLKKRFPEGRWFWVAEGLGLENGGDLLGVLPVTAANRKTLDRWAKAHSFFQQADLERFEQGNGRMEPVLHTLEGSYPFVKGDPFLESVFWDKRAAYEYADLDYGQNLLSYRMAVTRGYPTAELYCKLGELLLVKGRVAEAEQALERATRAPLDWTPAGGLLKGLQSRPAPPPAPN